MNELAIVNNIEKELQKPVDIKVFPLTPTHRKELRQLRDRNIGELRQRLRTIKQLKTEEYIKKHKKEIQAELRTHEKLIKGLNQDWDKVVRQIKTILRKRKEDESKVKEQLGGFSLSKDYNDISSLDVETKTLKRQYSIDIENVSKKIATEEFEKKFGESFQKSQDHIDKLYQMYEEAINFGDLEIVKGIYYKLKNADSFFEKLSEIKI